MAEPDDPESAAVFDFLDDLFEDRQCGVQRPLAHYLARYPRYEAAIAREYLARVETETQAGPPPDPGAPADGRPTVGPYRLLRTLGHGGQGIVWLAEDTRIARRVALKMLGSGFVTDERRARFRREAESVAQLAHPGLCAVLDAEIAGDHPYIAMQYVPGRDLATLLAESAREPVPVVPRDRAELRRLLWMFEHAARALHVAHEAGLVHRDVKPANLMVTPEGEPVVLDFGLARPVDADGTDAPLTLAGQVYGTPQYMSPEQLAGERDLDARTDVYSLGVALFECLTGERPFERANRLELERAVRFAPLPVAKLPLGGADLAAVLQAATDKDRERRIASALDLAEELRRLREGEPVRARPAGLLVRAARWARREPALFGAVCATVLALAVGLSLALWVLAQERAAFTRTVGRQFGTRVEELLQRDPAYALALGVEAADRLYDHRIRSALVAALDECRLEATLEAPHALRSYGLACTPDGRAVSLFSVQQDGDPQGRLLAWKLDGGATTTDVALPRDRPQSLAVDPGGATAWVGTAAGEVLAIDLATGTVRWRAARPDDDVGACLALAFDAPRGRLAAGYASGDARLLDPRDGTATADLAGGAGGGGALAFSADGASLLSSSRRLSGVPASDSARATLWTVAGGTAVTLEHGAVVTWSEWAPDGGVVTAGVDGRVVWHAAAGGESRTLARVDGVLDCAVHAPGGGRLALALQSGQVLVREEDGDLRAMPQPHEGRAVEVTWSADGAHLASVGFDNTLRVWDVDEGALLARGRASQRPLGCRFEPARDGAPERVIAWTLGYRLHRWRVGEFGWAYRLRGHSGPVTAARFLGDGARALTTGADGTARVWSTPDDGTPPHEEARIDPGAGPLDVLRVDGVGARAVVGGGARAFALDLASADVRGELPLGAVAELTPDGAVWATTDVDGELSLWRDLARRVHVPDARVEHAVALRASPDSARLALAGDEVVVVDVTRGEAVARLALERPVRDVAWSPDGATLAVLDAGDRLYLLGGHDGARRAPPRPFAHARLARSALGWIGWDDRSGARLAFWPERALEPVRPTAPPRAPVTAVVAGRTAEDEGVFCAVASDGSLLAWSTRDGARVLELRLLREAATDVDLDGGRETGPAGARARRVLVASRDGTVAVWPLDPLPAVRARLPRPLTDLEMRREWLLVTGDTEP